LEYKKTCIYWLYPIKGKARSEGLIQGRFTLMMADNTIKAEAAKIAMASAG
jgi:hypothetical protein